MLHTWLTSNTPSCWTTTPCGPRRWFGFDADRDHQAAGGAQQRAAGQQQPVRVDGGAGPVQQDQVDVAGGVADAGQVVRAAQGVVAPCGLRGGGGEGDVVVDVEDDIADLGVAVQEQPGQLWGQAAGLLRGGVRHRVGRTSPGMASGLASCSSGSGWVGLWCRSMAGSAPALAGHACI